MYFYSLEFYFIPTSSIVKLTSRLKHQINSIICVSLRNVILQLSVYESDGIIMLISYAFAFFNLIYYCEILQYSNFNSHLHNFYVENSYMTGFAISRIMVAMHKQGFSIYF